MKKILILGVCALMSASAFAQVEVVKEAERAMKKKAPYTEVVKIITPAFSDPSTQELAQTYYIPGKAGFQQYDDYIGLKALNKLPENGTKIMADALLGGYDYFMKAIPLDSKPNEKGQVKPKYTKDMVNTAAGHYHDFNSVAIDYWNLKEYDNAYRAWEIFIDMSENPIFEGQIKVPNDTLIGEIMYNQALAAWQADRFRDALNSFLNAKNHGYTKKNIYDYAIAVATKLEDSETIEQLANEAMANHPEFTADYIGYVINGRLKQKDFQNAVSLIDKAIAANPDNAQYYVIRGILFEQDEIEGDPKAEYQKAVDLDPYNARALFNLGRMYFNEGVVLNDKAPTDQQAYSKMFVEEIRPVFRKAIELLESAWNIDNDNADCLDLLGQAYYIISDEAGIKSVEERK